MPLLEQQNSYLFGQKIVKKMTSFTNSVNGYLSIKCISLELVSAAILENDFNRNFHLWKSSMFKHGYVAVNELLMSSDAI